MSPNQAAQTQRCTHCGAALTGRFCSDCGSRVEGASPPPPHDLSSTDGWRGIASDFWPEEKNGIFSVLLSFARHPVQTIIRLTDDPLYRSHWSFLAACLGAQLTLSYLVLPRLMTAIFGTEMVETNQSVFTTEIVQYTGIAILLPVQYYLCRAFGTIPRSPRAYAKLCALSVAYSAVLAAALLTILVAVFVTLMQAGVSSNGAALSGAAVAVNVVAVLVFVSWSHKIFWGMKWPTAIAVTLAIAVLSWSVVYPGLGMLAQQTGIAKVLDSIAT